MKIATLVYVGAFARGKFQTNGVTFSGIFQYFLFRVKISENCDEKIHEETTLIFYFNVVFSSRK